MLYQQFCKPVEDQWLTKQHNQSMTIQTRRLVRLLQTASLFQNSIYDKTIFNKNEQHFEIPAALSQPDTTYITPFNQKQTNMFCAGCNKPLQQEQQCWWCYYSGQMYCSQCQQIATETPGSLMHNLVNEVTIYVKYQHKIQQQLDQLIWNEQTLPQMFRRNKNLQQLINLRRQILTCLIQNPQKFVVQSQQSYQLKAKDICLMQNYLNVQYSDFIQKLETNKHTKILNQILTDKHYHLIDIHEAVFYHEISTQLDVIASKIDDQRYICQNVGYFTLNDISSILKSDMLIVALKDVIRYLKSNGWVEETQHCICYQDVKTLDNDIQICRGCGKIYHKQCAIFIDGLCEVCYGSNDIQ